MAKCASKDRNGDPCRNYGRDGLYCKFHTYMNEYTPEMVENVKLCTTCSQWKFMGDYNTCEECRERGIKNRQEAKESIVLCAKDGCKFKKSINKYCGKHQANHFKEETESMGMKTCKQYLRGCRSQLEVSYKYTRCEVCLKKEREKDHDRRGSIIEVKEVGKKPCSVCCKVFSMESFQGLHGETKTCSACREANKRADEKRDAEHVKELARKNEKKPERKAVKLAWKELNYEKVAKYWIDARKKLIENDLEGYLKKNAENAKKWRDANPEKCEKSNKERSENINYHFVTYKRSAETKQLDFKLTKGDFIEMVESECHYCGIIQEKGFNGVDRLDSDSNKGYIMSNCVSCCEMCNFMKGCLGPTIFINRIEHITTHLKIFQGNLHPEDFKDIANVNYNDYKSRANRKDLDFDLSKSLFNEKIKEPCYLCGKNISINHKNGLDRFDSDVGYIESNVKSCCGNCNMIKRDYIYDDFVNKCKLICEKNVKPIKRKLIFKTKETFELIDCRAYDSNKPNESSESSESNETNELIKEIPNSITKVEKIVKEKDQQEKTQIVRGNKLTQEEIREKERIKKQKQRDAIKEKYGDQEYRKMRAEEIARTRQKKKLIEQSK